MFSERSHNISLFAALICFLAILTVIAGMHWAPVFGFVALIALLLVVPDLKSYCDDGVEWLQREFLIPYLG